MGLYEGFGMGNMLANFHMCGITLVLRRVFNMLVRNASPLNAKINWVNYALDKPSMHYNTIN